MNVLFCRPPRYLWYIHSEHSSFWQPLAFCSMAAYLRENLDWVHVSIKDCPIDKCGWKSTKMYLERVKPDILCVGEETVSSHEAIKLARIYKSIRPDGIVIAGGVYFGFEIEKTLHNPDFDFIVIGEGEKPLLNLIKEIKKDNPEYKNVRGIAYAKNNKFVRTSPETPIKNLDDLPFPAYDLVPMEKYGNNAETHRDFVSVEHSRGCTSKCNFCILWKSLGKPSSKDPNYDFNPLWRTKSPRRMIDEMVFLKEKYQRKTFNFVDPSFNISTSWNDEFSQAIIDEGHDFEMSCWYRIDCLLRDEDRGKFTLQVKAGVKQIMTGIERLDTMSLNSLDKGFYSFENTKRAFEIIRNYPSVLSIGTFIYGLPFETKATMKEHWEKLAQIPVDIAVPIPLTPNPGGKYRTDMESTGLIEENRFRFYNYTNLIMRSKELSRNQILWEMILNNNKYMSKNHLFGNLARNFSKKRNTSFSRRNAGRRNLTKSYVKAGIKFCTGILINNLTGQQLNYSIKPRWYDT